MGAVFPAEFHDGIDAGEEGLARMLDRDRVVAALRGEWQRAETLLSDVLQASWAVPYHRAVSAGRLAEILIQQGKSADLAAAFGGQGSQTAFGPRGAANLLTRLTTYSAIVFMLTSIGLTILLSRSSDRSVLSGHQTTQQSAPAKK